MLTSADHAILARSWITPDLAEAAGLYRVSSSEGGLLIGRNGHGNYAGIAFPYIWPGENHPREYRLKLDHPEMELQPDGAAKEKRKYLSPPGRANILYFAPGASGEALNDTVLPIIVTEGEKKVLALSRLSERVPVLPVGLSGVWNWRGAVGREPNANGMRVAVKGPIADLNRINWQGRIVYIIFDSDKKNNASIQAAERELARELKRRGAVIHIIDMPDLPGLEKTGADDFLAHPDGGPDAMAALIENAPEFEPGGIILDPADPMPSARRFVESFYTNNYARCLQHQAGVFYSFNESSYIEKEESTIKAQLYEWLEVAQAWQKPKNKDDEPELGPFKPTAGKVGNVLDATRAVCNLPASFAAPCWLANDPGLNPREFLAVRNGLLHIPTRKLFQPTPDFFTLSGLDFEYNPNAPEPVNWIEFLKQLWPEDFESRDALQEWFGYLLTPDTRLQKILMLIGPKRAGKGTIGRIIKNLLGSRNICTPTLANMNEQFGLSVLIGKTAAIISDARLSGRTDTAIITERLLSISGEDSQTVPRKFLPDWNGTLPTRFMMMTNELPKIEDASGTLASRFIILTLTESFYGREDHTLIDKLLPELPGILLWALEGWERLHRRGRLIQPQSSSELIAQFEDLGSPIGAFVRDRCEIGPGHEVRQDRLFEQWKAWCEETGREHPGTIQTFGRNLQSFVPWLKVLRPRVMGVQLRYYSGIRLKGSVEPL